MDHFELFEKVTGRVSLKTGKILGAELKEACKKTGAQYHEAADEVLISGAWEQVLETRRIIYNRNEEGNTRNSSSSDYSESTSSKPGRVVFDTSPPIAKYIKSLYDGDLKNIEQKYQVKISWSKDYTKVHIKAKPSGANYSDNLFNTACDQFAEIYRQFRQTVTNIAFNVSQEGNGYSKEILKSALCAVPRFVPGLIVDRSSDDIVYNLWGTSESLSQASQWIRKQLGVTFERPRCVSPKGPTKDALSHETTNKLKIVVYQGDITKENADVIVNASNEHLDHAGGVSYAISKAGGSKIQKESDDYVAKHGALDTGDVAVTGSGFLHCKYIVHAVGPQWKRHGKEGCMKLFQTLFMNVYKAAINHGAKSIAMPAISSGIYGVPKNVCAQATFSFVDEIDQKLASDPTARPFEIRLVNIDDEIAKTFTQEFNKWLLKGRKVQRRHSFNAITREDKEKLIERKSVDDMHKTPRLKASLVSARKPLQSSARLSTSLQSKIKHGSSGTSLDTSYMASKIKHGSSGTSLDTSSMASKIKHGSSGTSLDTSSMPSKIKHGSSWTSLDTSSTTSSHGPTSACFRTFSNNVKIITTVASTLQHPSDRSSVDPTSSISCGLSTNHSKFNSSIPTTRTSTTGSPSYNASVLPTSQSSSPSKHDKSGSTTTVRYDQNGIGSHSSHSADDSDDCTICYCPYTDPVSLPKCGHTFCKSCIERAFTYQKKCPLCQEVYGVFEGDQPDGTMDIQLHPHSLPGYEGYNCYVITYVIPSSHQGNKHPKPGHKFTGTKRQAFLPATEEGEVVLKMLRKAFDMKLIFTVGRSNTTGQEDCVTWNDIHHKTSINGGPQNFGYPDPDYLGRVKDELKAKGIVPE